jgi:DNA-binding transcriptional ArsR family regulator
MRSPSVTHHAEMTFNALGDPTRRAVLDLLRRGSLPAGRIAQAFPVSRPAISKHLRLLRRARLVRERREGRHRVYQLDAAPLQAVDSWLSHYRVFWGTQLKSLKGFVEAEHARESRGAATAKRSGRNRRKGAQK